MPIELAVSRPLTKAEIVDEYGELARRIRMYRPDEDRAEALRKIINGWFGQDGADLEFKVEGRAYVLRIGKRAIKRTLPATSMRRVFKALGQAQFLATCTYPLNLADELKIEGLVVEVREGPRKIEAIAIGPAVVK